MTRTVTIELHKEDMGFSAGHFTVFSATERESLHGHNYQVAVKLTLLVDNNGIAFNYKLYKNKIRALCHTVDETFLLPKQCQHIHYQEEGDYVYALFNGERIPFLKKDITFLPVRNITVEELSNWFLQQFTETLQPPEKQNLLAIEMRVYSGLGQWGSTRWENRHS